MSKNQKSKLKVQTKMNIIKERRAADVVPTHLVRLIWHGSCIFYGIREESNGDGRILSCREIR
jgi:hypothetical protein